MGIISFITSVFIVVSTFVSSHVASFLAPTNTTETKAEVLSMDNTKEEKIATSSAVESTNPIIIDNSGDSNVDVEIKNGSSKVNISQNNSGSSNPQPNSSLDNLKYPGASMSSSSGNSMILESADNTDAITNWYKDKIVSLGMNTKSFVTTKSNDKVLNKLVGANGSKEVSVEISRENFSAKVIIKVNI